MADVRLAHATDDRPRRGGLRLPRRGVGLLRARAPRAALTLARALLVLLAASPALAADDDDARFRPANGIELATRLRGGPVVVRAQVIEVDAKARLDVEETYRGKDLPKTLTVAFRSPNLSREPGTPAFRTEAGERAVFVLTPWTDYHGEVTKRDLWVPAGGYLGKIPVPPEGAPALLEAVSAIVDYQDGEAGGGGAAALGEWLAGSNPWLIDFALDQVAKLGLADRRMADALLARTVDDSPVRRSRAVAALGLALERGRFEVRRSFAAGAAPSGDGGRAAREAIVRLARTDPDAAVRREAVKQFGSGRIPGGAEILAAIAKDDPVQEVRYEAASSLADLNGLPKAR